ncbi:MAG: hypothetical protein CL927_03955 [Deltaproteobacteria bacterium]|nr:hypothetical protein [Deltaproteobacteria bacterium]
MSASQDSPGARPPRTIRTRILLAFLLSLVASATALGHSLLQLDSIGRNVSMLDRGYLPLARVAAELETISRQMDREHDRLTRSPPTTVTGYRANADFYSGGISDAVERGQRIANRLERKGPLGSRDQAALDETRRLLQGVDEARQGYDTAFAAWANEAAQDGSSPTPGRTIADLDGRRTQLILRISQLSQIVDGRITLLSRLTARAQATATRVSGALALLAVLLSGLLTAAALVALRPFGELTAQVQRLAQGDYAGRLPIRGADEVTLLAREFNTMAEAVSERDRRLSERARTLDVLTSQLRGILDTIRAGLLVVDGNEVRIANPAAERLWPTASERFVPTSLSSLPVGRHEGLQIEDRLYDVDVVSLAGGEGRLIVGEDITRRESDRARVARSERLALVGQMLAQITHEVRNPLNAMSLNADLLSDEIEDPEQRAMLDTISDEIRRLEQLTARYLELSRGRRPDLHLASPREVLEDVLSADLSALEQQGLNVRILGERPPPMELDIDALRRAVRNILRNAAEAGASTVDVRFVQDPETVHIELMDNGPGMAPDQLRRAFDPFFTTKASGTGLGLAISRQELEDVGAGMSARSTLGKGSRFSIHLPLETTASDPV